MKNLMATKLYDVFLSFNSEDRDAVEKIAVYLKKKATLRPWFDQWELIPGEPWVRNLERGLTASLTCAVFVGQSGEGPWQKREVETALRQQVDNPDFRVIPVLLPDVPKKPELPLFLVGNMWVDFRKKGLDDDDALWRLECGIRGMPPGQGRSNAGDRERQPTIAQIQSNVPKASDFSTPQANFHQNTKLLIIKALLDCPTMKDRAKRDAVVEQLPVAISSSITRYNADKFDITNIVDTCVNYPDGIEKLIEVVHFFEEDSIPMQKVYEVLNRAKDSV